MKSPFFLFLFVSCILSVSAVSQTDKNETFNEAKLHLANHKLNMAIPILERLWRDDPGNANLNYLLGLCYVKEDVNAEKAVELLETASSIYTENYQAGSNRERRAPEYVYYYLTIAYSKTGQCEKALQSLNKFYQVYTYQDEYYLVDGQKWVRECNLEKKEEKTPPALAQRIDDDPVSEEINEEPLVQAEAENVPEIKPALTPDPVEEVTVVEEQPAAEAPKPVVEEPRFKERLIPFDEWEKLRTRPVDYTTMSSLYGVQVAALIDLKPTREFEGLKNVEVYVDENGVFRYVIGRFSYRSQAEALKAKIKERGYEDAFIVDVNQPMYNTEVLGVGTENINWSITGDVDFRVQIGAFRTMIPSAVAEKYLMVDGIKENPQNDLTILTVGNFEHYEDAASFRDDMIEQGITDAFVVSFNYGRKVPLKEAIEHVKREEGDQPEAESEEGKKKKDNRKPADF